MPAATAAPTTKQYHSIVFLDGDEADTYLYPLLNSDPEDITVHGPSEESIASTIEALSAWDYGDESEHSPRDNPGHGPDDKIVVTDPYILSWNFPLRHIALTRVVTTDAPAL